MYMQGMFQARKELVSVTDQASGSAARSHRESPIGDSSLCQAVFSLFAL
jgi:hypothetical protein